MSDPVSSPLPLASGFPAATREEWLGLVDKVLKGRSFERLAARTYDGLRIEPLAPRAMGAVALAGRPARAPWHVVQRVDQPDADAANRQALHDLENGATGLSLVFRGSSGDIGFGLDPSGQSLGQILEGIYLDADLAIDLDLPQDAAQAIGALTALIERRKLSPAAVNIRFGLDPIGARARTGIAAGPWADEARRFAQAVFALEARGYRGPFATADGRIVHAAGGAEAQELAFVLATGVAYLRALESVGLTLDTARRAIDFRLAVDADEFLSIAKFRALRKLWARVEESCGLKAAPIFIAADCAWRMMTRRDPHVNMLRATIAVFAAAVGGANAITVLPFTAALGLPDQFARRVARNTQLVLAEESNLAMVADPAAGSGALETLTDALARAAWSLFQEIERSGGIAESLAQGAFQAAVAKVRAERQAAVATRRDPLTGTSEFPNLKERAEAILAPAPIPGASPAVNALRPMRLAEPFEILRDAADRMRERAGVRPAVFLATLGTPPDFLARATFAQNFFAAGGIDASSNDGFATQAAMVAAFAESKTILACLCSTDERYGTEAAAAAEALKAAGARHIYLAGRPGEIEAALRSAGVTDFIYAGCDVLATLEEAHRRLGLA